MQNSLLLPEYSDITEVYIKVDISKQKLTCYHRDQIVGCFDISTGANGVGEMEGSGCTPRGKHEIKDIIGLNHEINAVFVGRLWTGEIYSKELVQLHPKRDWILTRILRLNGLEPGFNQGGLVDTYNRYIYIHGAPDEVKMGVPGSHGCIRMRNHDVVALANWAKQGLKVLID
jgi:L,D-transpeptidase catalytic domain